MNEDRGKIKKISLDIEYPDGTETEVVLDPIAEGIQGLTWSPDIIEKIYGKNYRTGSFHGKESKSWDADNWMKRPTFAIFRKVRGQAPWP